MKVLAVDDDPLVLDLFKINFEEMGMKNLHCVDSAKAALQCLKDPSLDFDVILLDIDMPEMDGITLCQRIRQDPRYQSTSILMVTAHTNEETVRKAFAAGATDYMCKPIYPLELAARMQSATHLMRQRRKAESNFEAAQEMKAQLELEKNIKSTSAFKVDFVPSMIEKLELENYVLQLSRLEILKTEIYAFGIKEFSEIYRRSHSLDLYHTIGDVASALQSVFGIRNTLISYCGSGKFVLVTRQSETGERPNLAEQVQNAVNDLELVYNNGAACKATMISKGPLRCSIWSFSNALKMMQNALCTLTLEEKKDATLTDEQEYKSLLEEYLRVA